jgi:hypothetical protein
VGVGAVRAHAHQKSESTSPRGPHLQWVVRAGPAPGSWRNTSRSRSALCGACAAPSFAVRGAGHAHTCVCADTWHLGTCCSCCFCALAMHLFSQRRRRDGEATLEDLESVLTSDSAGEYVPPVDPDARAPPPSVAAAAPSSAAPRAGATSTPSRSAAAQPARAAQASPTGLHAGPAAPPGRPRALRQPVLSVTCVRCSVPLLAPVGAPSIQCGRCGQVCDASSAGWALRRIAVWHQRILATQRPTAAHAPPPCCACARR